MIQETLKYVKEHELDTTEYTHNAHYRKWFVGTRDDTALQRYLMADTWLPTIMFTIINP
jgi:hypothetical protein